jgi:hypothetical protein
MFPVFPFDARNATVQNIIFLQPSKKRDIYASLSSCKVSLFCSCEKIDFFSREM